MTRLVYVWLATALLAACASEDWNNRFDPESKTYRAPCADAPDEERASCVLWEEFDAGLTRWLAEAPPAGSEAIRVEAAAPDGVATVLRMPACADGNPGLAIELDEPAAALALEIIWRLADAKASQISVPVVGIGADSLLTTSSAPAPFTGWQATVVEFTGGGDAAVLGLDCAPSAYLVARIALRRPAP